MKTSGYLFGFLLIWLDLFNTNTKTQVIFYLRLSFISGYLFGFLYGLIVTVITATAGILAAHLIIVVCYLCHLSSSFFIFVIFLCFLLLFSSLLSLSFFKSSTSTPPTSSWLPSALSCLARSEASSHLRVLQITLCSHLWTSGGFSYQSMWTQVSINERTVENL